MTRRRTRSTPLEAPKTAAPQVEQVEQAGLPTIGEWARELISEMATHISEEEQAFLAAQVDAVGRDTPATLKLAPDPTRPLIIRDKRSLKTLAARVDAADDLVVDIETSNLEHRKGVIVGIGLADGDGTAYVPINHRFQNGGVLRPQQLPLSDVLDALRLQDKDLINHNVKFEIKWLRHHGGITCRFKWDTMIAARLLRSDLSADLEVVAVRELDVPGWSLTRAEMQEIEFLPIEYVAAYNAKDTWYTFSLYRRQQTCLA